LAVSCDRALRAWFHGGDLLEVGLERATFGLESRTLRAIVQDPYIQLIRKVAWVEPPELPINLKVDGLKAKPPAGLPEFSGGPWVSWQDALLRFKHSMLSDSPFRG
jgi:hypothetical protein